MFHDLPFREPNKSTRAVSTPVRDQRTLKNVDRVSAGMCVAWVDDPARVADELKEHASFEVRVQHFAKDRGRQVRIDALLPGHRVAIDSEKGGWINLQLLCGVFCLGYLLILFASW